MANKRMLRFPDGFLWGTATSSYQYEGGITNNQWYRWEQEGHIRGGRGCGEAVGWWEHAEDDFAWAEQMGNNALRLSIEWSRIEPEEGKWESAALERYRAMLSDLRKRGIRPLVTLHHFTEPLWFADRGGFAKAENIRYFVRYVTYVVERLRDLCDFWLTINELNVYVVQGYVLGESPPGEQSLLLAKRVMHNLIQSHVEAFYAIRRLQPEAEIGYCLDYRPFDPAQKYPPVDCSLSWLYEKFFTWSMLQASESGYFSFPLGSLLAPITHAAGARDYHGVNYYTREMIGFDLRAPDTMFVRRSTPPGAVLGDAGGDTGPEEVYPAGLYRVLKDIHRRTRGNKPLYITENGLRDEADRYRPQAILEHLAMVHRAIREGIPVGGYFHWTLIDDFEWLAGWTTHLGLIAIEPETQKRIPRPSSLLYGEICRANALTEEIVKRYAPQSMERIFG